MAHVRVERLAAGDDQEHRAQHGEAVPSMLAEERERVTRIDRGQNDGLPNHLAIPSTRDHDEPHHHDRTEQAPDAVGAVTLNREHPDQNHDRDRHHVRIEERRRDLEPFDRAKHRDRRRDHAVAVEQRRTEDAQEDEHGPARPVALALRQQGGQREDAAFALVVGPHDDGDVLDRDDEQQ